MTCLVCNREQIIFLNDNAAEYLHMTLYIVRAKPKKDISGLRKEMDSGKISNLRPFGRSLQYSLENARMDNKDGYATWVEEDYCSPPLAMEREAVLDRYFSDITVDRVESEVEGWNKINDQSMLWKK
jgi:hypothetical protein